ncbi:MAG: DUF4954 family protein [Bacteroidales bacterium]|nr:DUF4954 family protein [Bacteroidales bacterium]
MRNLTPIEIAHLIQKGNMAADWSSIYVPNDFVLDSVTNVSFGGHVEIGEHVVLRNIRVELSNYKIGNNVTIIDCGTIAADGDSTFGIGHEVAVVNEAGGREVKLSADLTNNIAYIVAMHRYNQLMVAGYNRLVEMEARAVKGKATISEGATIIGCQTIRNVNVGRGARLEGCSLLENGTIVSRKVQPTIVGHNVIARDFVLAEGAQLTDGANIKSTYIGQCSQVGAGFFAENCLIFCNCQLFNGEAVSAFCGPFTVSHHKTSLLIAGIYSFFNAGSATNASNHHYRLGPSHQAVYERGVKTGSGSYLLEPARIGAYTMVVGQHKGNPDTSQFPFSYLVEKNGESYLMPAQNLRTIGIFRDERKWLKRDGRVDELVRDHYTVDVLNPLTVGKMISAVRTASEMCEKTAGDTVMCGGYRIQKGLLSRAAKSYNEVAQAYVVSSYMKNQDVVGAEMEWVDCGGLIVPKEQLETLEINLAEGLYTSVADIAKAFKTMANYYQTDKAVWCAKVAHDEYAADGQTDEENRKVVTNGFTSIMNSMIADAQKEFSKKLATGYGLDNEDQAYHEYTIIKGTTETNQDVEKCRAHWAEIINN